MILADWIIENNFVLQFLLNGEGLHCLSQHVLPKLSKITVTQPQSVKKRGTVLTCLKLAKWISTLNCSRSAKLPIWNLYISSHGEARNIKFGQQVNIIERVPSDTPHVKSWLGTFPLGLVTSLPFDYVTFIKLYISSFREATGDTFIHAKA